MSPSRFAVNVSLVVLAFCTVSDSAFAGISASKARKQLKAARTAAIAQIKSGAEVAMEELFLAARQLEIDAQQGQYDVTKLQQFAVAYSDAQVEIRAAIETTDFYDRVGSILADFADGADLNGDFPKGFESGDGGVLDDFDSEVHAMIDGLFAKLTKRLKKTARLLEDEGIFFTFRVRRPGKVIAGTANPDSGGIQPNPYPILEVDGVFASSLAAADDDGIVIVAGFGHPYNSLSVVMGPGSIGGSVDEQVGSGRFIGDPIMGVPEGNYFATVYDNSPMNTTQPSAITFNVQ